MVYFFAGLMAYLLPLCQTEPHTSWSALSFYGYSSIRC
jgi:hypothetical protein